MPEFVVNDRAIVPIRAIPLQYRQPRRRSTCCWSSSVTPSRTVKLRERDWSGTTSTEPVSHAVCCRGNSRTWLTRSMLVFRVAKRTRI